MITNHEVKSINASQLLGISFVQMHLYEKFCSFVAPISEKISGKPGEKVTFLHTKLFGFLKTNLAITKYKKIRGHY